MAQPTMITLTGNVQTPPSTPDATFTVTMEQQGYLMHADGTVIEPTVYTGSAAADGSISFQVPASTDPAWDYVVDGKIVGTTWAYRVVFDPIDNGKQGAPFYAGVPHDLGATLTLNDIIPAGNLSQTALYAPINHTHAGGGGGAVSSVFGRSGAVVAQTGDYTKAQVGLGNVDNTSDVNKPVSTAQQTALNGKAATVHTHASTDISDSTATGRSVLTAASQSAARTAIGAGTSSLTLGTAAGTAAAGNDIRIPLVLAVGAPLPGGTQTGQVVIRY